VGIELKMPGAIRRHIAFSNAGRREGVSMEDSAGGMVEARDRDSPRKPRGRFTRNNVAWAILGLAMASIALGLIRKTYQGNAYNEWQARLVHGEPVVVRFICGPDLPFDCNDEIRITYEKRGNQWCETLWRNAETEPTRARWCDANPEWQLVDLYGELYSFDRYGVVRRASHLVGRLFVP